VKQRIGRIRIAAKACCALGSAIEIVLDTIGQGIKSEVGNVEHPPSSAQNMSGQHSKFQPDPLVDGGKINDCRRQGHHILESGTGQQPDILQLVALFQEADRLLRLPPRRTPELFQI